MKLTVPCLITGLILSTLSVFSQPVFKSSNDNSGNGNIATVAKPVGALPGEIFVAAIMLEKGLGVDVTPPTGWSLIRRTNFGTDAGIATYFKIVTGYEASNFTFELTNSPKWCIGISRISNVDAADPVDVSRGSVGNAGHVVSMPVVTQTDNCLIVAFYTNKKNATYSQPPGTIKRYDEPNNTGGQPSNMMATRVQPIAGVTPALAAIPSHDEKWASQQIAFRPSGSGGVLPVKLISFDAKIITPGVHLTWKTENEINNQYIAVEHSIDGNRFSQIGKLNAMNSVSVNEYNFTHATPVAGANFYRLRQVDLDGKATYHHIIKVSFKVSEVITVYPNPTADLLKVKLTEANASASLQIIDQAGRIVKKQIIQAGTIITEMRLKDLAPGRYIVQITQNNKTINKAIIKI